VLTKREADVNKIICVLNKRTSHGNSHCDMVANMSVALTDVSVVDPESSMDSGYDGEWTE
jgi:hypothetical protein